LKISRRLLNDRPFASQLVFWLCELGVLTVVNVASNVILDVATICAKYEFLIFALAFATTMA
jgi:hypothetical protein